MEDYFTAPGRCGRTADLTSDLRYFADHDFGASFFARVPVVFTEFIFYSFEFSTVLFTLFYFVSFRTKSRNGRTLRQIRFICNILSCRSIVGSFTFLILIVKKWILDSSIVDTLKFCSVLT